ncbi:MAG: hypothetical protein IPH45_00885 [Bacteroidales bacterium]|nr:hypothetical protein [Bacteroidales bacterium]
MHKVLRYILFAILLVIGLQSYSQYSIDKVCIGAVRHYRIDGEPNATYTWKIEDPSGTQNILLSTADTVEIEWNVTAGLYQLSCIQHSANDCDAVMELGTIEVFAQPFADAGPGFVLCNTLQVSVTQAQASDYSYLVWSSNGDGYFSDSSLLNPEYFAGPDDILQGTVILSLTAYGNGNSNACIPSTSSLVVTIDNLSVLSVQALDATCGQSNGSIQISATGTGTLQFSIDNGTSWSSDSLFTNLSAGAYTIKVKDDFCETPYLNNPVIINSLGGPQILAVTATDATCGQSNGSIQISATGTGTLQFSIDNGTSWSSDSLFTNLSAGTYTIKVKDDFCETPYLNNPVIINSLGGPQILAVTATDATCGQSNGSIQISATGTGTLQFSIDNGTSWSSDSLFTNLSAGTYTIKVKDDFCETPYLNNPVIINSLGGPQILAVTATDATCGQSNGSIKISATGTGTLQFSIDNGTSWSSDSLFTNLSAGTYNIKVKDDFCETPYLNNPVIINSLGGPQILAVTATDATCGQSNGSIQISATGTGTLQFSIDNGTSWSSDSLFTNLSAGTYTIKVKDDFCETPYLNNPVIINSLGGPQILAVNTTDATCGQSNGSIQISATGTGTLQFSIDNGTSWSSDSLFTNLSAGTYSIKVKDDFCETPYLNNPVIINSLGGPQILAVTATDATCGQSNGSIQISATGTGTLQFSIDNGTSWSSDSLFTNLSAGKEQNIECYNQPAPILLR